MPDAASALPDADPDAAATPPVYGCSVVIATRNRPQMISDAVDSVLGGVVVPAEVIVVDQSPEINQPLARIRHPGCDVRVVRSSVVGLSAARNLGIAEARTGVVVFTDDDILAERLWLFELIRALRDGGDATVVVGRVIAGPEERPGARTESLTPPGKPRVHRGRLTTDPLAGGNMAASRSDLVRLGGFDERLGAGGRYPGADDNDLGFRLLEAGYTILYVPEATVVHRAWRVGGDLTRLQWIYGLGQGGFYGKHLSLRDRWILWRLIDEVVWHFPGRGRSKGDLAYLAGLVLGVTRWQVEERVFRRLSSGWKPRQG